MSTIVFGAVAGNYSDDTKWVGGVKPTAADDAQGGASSANLAVDVASVARSLDFTGYTATFSGSSTLAIGDGTNPAGNSYIKLVAGMTFSYSGTITIKNGATGSNTITSAGKTFAALNLEGFATNTPNVTLTDAIIVTGTLQQNGGSFNSAGFTMTVGRYLNGGGNGRTVTLTNSTINITTTNSGSCFDVTNATVSAAGTTINIVNASANSRTFAGFGKTFGTLSYTVNGSTGALVLTGANTFSAINFTDTTNARTLTLPASTVTTITTGSGFNVNGTAGKLMTIQSSSAGTPATIAITSGTISVDYVVVKDITVTGGGFFAGDHSTDGGGNTGVTFSASSPSATPSSSPSLSPSASQSPSSSVSPSSSISLSPSSSASRSPSSSSSSSPSSSLSRSPSASFGPPSRMMMGIGS